MKPKICYFRLWDFYEIDKIGKVLVGIIESGTLEVGMKLNVEGSIFAVETIEADHKKMQKADVGTAVGMSFGEQPIGFLEKYSGDVLVFSEEGDIDSLDVSNFEQTTSNIDKLSVPLKIVVNKKDWYLMMQLGNDSDSIVNYINPKEIPIITESLKKANYFLQKAKEINSVEKKVATLSEMEIYAIKHDGHALIGLKQFKILQLIKIDELPKLIDGLCSVSDKAKDIQKILH